MATREQLEFRRRDIDHQINQMRVMERRIVELEKSIEFTEDATNISVYVRTAPEAARAVVINDLSIIEAPVRIATLMVLKDQLEATKARLAAYEETNDIIGEK